MEELNIRTTAELIQFRYQIKKYWCGENPPDKFEQRPGTSTIRLSRSNSAFVGGTQKHRNDCRFVSDENPSLRGVSVFPSH